MRQKELTPEQEAVAEEILEVLTRENSLSVGVLRSRLQRGTKGFQPALHALIRDGRVRENRALSSTPYFEIPDGK